MKKYLIKILSCLTALVMVVGFCFILSACTEDDSTNPEIKDLKIVNLSLNPSIELILDNDNKVLTASANNAEGNFVVANVNFVGTNIDSALELFLNFSIENGFIVAGEDVSNDQLKIGISGNKALELYNKLKAKAEDYLFEKNAEVHIVFRKVSKADLLALVIESLKDTTFPQRLSEVKLIELIKNSRLETKNIYSQELKKLYYELRYQEILIAKYEAVKVQTELLEKMPDLSSIAITLNGYEGETVEEKFMNYMNEKISLYKTEVENFKLMYKELILNNSEYKTAFNNYVEAKQTLLEAKLNPASSQQEIESLQELFEQAKINFYGDSEGNNVEEEQAFVPKVQKLLTDEKDVIDGFFDNVERAINKIFFFLDEKEINASVEMAKNNAYNSFVNDEEIRTLVQNSKTFWNALKPDIE